MRTLALNIAAAFVDMLVGITTRAAEKALDAQDALAPADQLTPAQREVQTARDNLIETVARLATAREHLNVEHAEHQAALQMHSSQAAQAFMRLQGIAGFSDALANTQAKLDDILNPVPNEQNPVIDGTADPAPSAAPVAAPEHDVAQAAADMIHEGSPVPSEINGG